MKSADNQHNNNEQEPPKPTAIHFSPFILCPKPPFIFPLTAAAIATLTAASGDMADGILHRPRRSLDTSFNRWWAANSCVKFYKFAAGGMRRDHSFEILRFPAECVRVPAQPAAVDTQRVVPFSACLVKIKSMSAWPGTGIRSAFMTFSAGAAALQRVLPLPNRISVL